MHKKSYGKWCVLLVKFLNRKQQAVAEVQGKCRYWRWRCRSRHLLKLTLTCISVWAIIKQAVAECRRIAMASDAYCWQNSWTATSDWWIGRKTSLWRCRLRHLLTCSIIPLLFGTLEIKPCSRLYLANAYVMHIAGKYLKQQQAIDEVAGRGLFWRWRCRIRNLCSTGTIIIYLCLRLLKASHGRCGGRGA